MIESNSRTRLLLVFLTCLALAAMVASGCDDGGTAIIVRMNAHGNVAHVDDNGRTYVIDVSSHPTATLAPASIAVRPTWTQRQAGFPTQWTFPDDLITFKITNLSPAGGDAVTARLTFPTAYAAGAVYFKAGAFGFSPYPAAVVNGNAVLLPLVDGGMGDQDSVNGQITDPGGPAVCTTRAWAVGSPVDGYGAIFHTTDGGATWTRQGSAQSVPDTMLADVAAVDADTAWVVGSFNGNYPAILRTEDGGRTWTAQGIRDGLPRNELYKISAVDADTAWAVGADGFVVKTEDGGGMWHRQGAGQIPEVHLQGVFALDARRVWITGRADGGFAVIMASEDGGVTWERLGSASTVPDTYFLDITMRPDGTGWTVGHGPNFLKTTDFGQTWRLQFGSMDPDEWLWDANAVWAVSDRVAWVSQDFGQITRTEDGGASWQTGGEATGSYMMDVEALDANIAWSVGVYHEAATGALIGSIARTIDGGRTWVNQPLPVETGLQGLALVH